MIFMKYGETREQYAERTKNYLGLGAKPQTPKQLMAMIERMKQDEKAKAKEVQNGRD